jgi:hypothetical protein
MRSTTSVSVFVYSVLMSQVSQLNPLRIFRSVGVRPYYTVHTSKGVSDRYKISQNKQNMFSFRVVCNFAYGLSLILMFIDPSLLLWTKYIVAKFITSQVSHCSHFFFVQLNIRGVTIKFPECPHMCHIE